ncbi:5-formyltetrahydrofolate cyclo-ligase [Pseudohaliea rubra]|uniref:5-formyltetrahydrofolate cyclo-ligase n=1 Tax=Pseudohaliea rubra DSM 19751 TaxID=1265313 RepID=A0A095XWR1_9GAMM|nr:5-formyltetrahydrofolate cyclo-ligase [Pseudohaliea rubra]KGE04101.1 5-formyltetrahydrofolate cyclo-ligase [Pseudohaliea rubra DSM 19751]
MSSTADAEHKARTHKAALRVRLRAARREQAASARDAAAQALAAYAPALPGWCAGARLAAYVAADGELDPAPLLATATAAGLTTYLPRVGADRALTFHRWTPGSPLVENRYGIGEPTPGEPIPVDALDLLCLPLVAFAGDGTRLGMGAGYYDRTLAASRPGLLLGLAFDCQGVDTLPKDPWDVPLDGVLTETGWRPSREGA